MAPAIVLLGPPGSGKGTQARRLEGFTGLATGDLLRAAREEGTELGRKAAGYMDRGELVPDAVIIGVVREALADLHDEPILFDGFPRTLAQAEALGEVLRDHGRELTAAAMIDVPDDVVAERILGRGEGPRGRQPRDGARAAARVPRGDRAAGRYYEGARAAPARRRHPRPG